MSKHTLGPFTVCKGVEGLKAPFAIHAANGGYRYVAEIWTSEADANLLAAAPEMLDGLKQAVAQFEYDYTMTPLDGMGALIRKLNAIIAKAESGL